MGAVVILAAALGLTVLDWETSLVVALLILAGFIGAQTAASYAWGRAYIGRAQPAASSEEGTNAFADAAKLAITTQGVVLGLISFSRSSELNLTLRVGTASLATGVLIGTVLYLLVVGGPPPDHRRGMAASLLLTFLLWALAFGLVCVVAGNWSAA